MGQFNEDGKLEGVGRKVSMYTDGGSIQILEGQFKNNKLSGFGARMEVQEDTSQMYAIGHWVDETHISGYGMLVQGPKTPLIGLFDNANILTKSGRTSKSSRTL